MSRDTSEWSRRAVIALAGAVAATGPGAASAQDVGRGNAKVVDGVLAYLGVVPAEIVRGFPRGHPEGAMHGGVPRGRHLCHLVLALFDAITGERIEANRVSVAVAGIGHVGMTRLDLDPMTIADTVTWGAFVRLPGRGLYDLTFSVWVADRTAAIVLPFRYAHPAG
ncbi:hypothetical protein [Natronohydrobacter thiooxidans]|uniref:hypothetical protein n=1 Tax=Natronohydrobacter thiooxidans TaxID=87172 RepID=UPI0008FF51CB|nr:hypothetical protein [Natronohydrobacter thiooxidans]